jgi:hypothetical protein
VGSPRQVPQQAQVTLNQPSAPPRPTWWGRSPSGGRRRASGVALFGACLLALAAILAGCGNATNPTAPAGSGAAPGALDSGGAAARLAAVLSQLASGYSFDTTVTVGGQVATEAKGRWVGGASEFTVTTSGAAITNRSLPPRSWVLQAGAGWVEVNGTVPTGNPLDALKAPGSTTVVAQTSDMLELLATYPPAVLGLSGSNAVDVNLVLASDGSLKATYSAAAGGATSATTITPDPGQVPIAAPSPS